MRVIKRNIEKVWGERYTLGVRYLYIIRDAGNVWGARYLPKSTVIEKSNDIMNQTCDLIRVYLLL
jgi:hypothetical protein